MMHLSDLSTYYKGNIHRKIRTTGLEKDNKAFIYSGYNVHSRPRTNEALRRRQRRPQGGAARTVPSPYRPQGRVADLRLVIQGVLEP
jgi:hypothetical protein